MHWTIACLKVPFMLLVLADLQFCTAKIADRTTLPSPARFRRTRPFGTFGASQKYEEYMHDRESGKFPLREFACSVFYRLLVPKGGAKSIRQGEKSGSCLRFRPKRCADKLAPAFLNGGTVAVPFSRFFTMRIRRALRAK